MKSFGLFIFAILFFICDGQAKVPKEWTSEMSLYLYNHDEHYLSWEMKITRDSCVYKESATSGNYKFKLSQEALNSMLLVMRTNKMHSERYLIFFGSPDGFKYAKSDSSGLQLKYGSKTISISEVNKKRVGALDSRYYHKQKKNYYSIRDTILAIAWKELDKQRVSVIIQVDSNIVNVEDKYLIIAIENVFRREYSTHASAKHPMRSTIEIRLFPATYQFTFDYPYYTARTWDFSRRIAVPCKVEIKIIDEPIMGKLTLVDGHKSSYLFTISK